VGFVDAANSDLHLSSADTSGAKNGATDLSGDAYPVTVDIDGTTRATWDIGADEYEVSGRTARVTRAKPIGVAHGMNFGVQY